MRLKVALVALSLLAVLALAPLPVQAQGGFDQYGYNYGARIFVGTGGGWCAQRGWGWDCAGQPLYAPYANDRLVMKWSKAWDDARFHGLPWTPDAWENNEWNGQVPGGSGEVWHYKIQWVGSCGPEGTQLPDGGYCIWGQFEVIMDQGTFSDHTHQWYALALPNGYGA